MGVRQKKNQDEAALLSSEGSPPSPDHMVASEKAMDKKSKILLIDDNYEFFTLLQASLGDKLELEYAGDGFTALQMVKKMGFDLILCDIYMPVINGLTLLSEFKRKNIDIPFLFITGNADDKIIREALQLGAYNFVEKPFDKQDLLTKVQRALELHAEEATNKIQDQDKAYIYNTLKMHYYDVEKIMRQVYHHNLPVSWIHKELEKKTHTGKCAFDDLANLKYYKSST